MSSFTFLHAADLHLGSPLTGLALKDEDVARRFYANGLGMAEVAKPADLAAIADRLRALGVEVDESQRDTFPGHARFHAFDGHGNRVEVLARDG